MHHTTTTAEEPILSAKLKADIRSLWDRFWSGGIANPLTAIEQITYLVFLKPLEDLDNQRAKEAQEAGRPHLSIFAILKTYRRLRKTRIAFHAKDDLPEIRFQVYKLLATLDFKAQFIVARKIERVFRNNFKAKEIEFYDHLVYTLFTNTLHRYQDNFIYFAKRGSRSRQTPLEQANPTQRERIRAEVAGKNQHEDSDPVTDAGGRSLFKHR